MFFLLKFINNKITLCDVVEQWQIGFQDPATPVMEGIINFHHDLMYFLIIITIFVCWLLFRIIRLFNENRNQNLETFVHGSTIEIVWTTIPALILLIIAIPSFALLYSMDEIIYPILTIKVVGSQWFWTYEYSDILNYFDNTENESLIFDSYMIQENDLDVGQFRLLEVDNRLVIPTLTHIRILITSSDVLHSWAVPSLGIKLDACPGRLNQTSIFVKREGVFYGQCSEICGVNHAFMPIVIEAVSFENYITWLENKINN